MSCLYSNWSLWNKESIALYNFLIWPFKKELEVKRSIFSNIVRTMSCLYSNWSLWNKESIAVYRFLIGPFSKELEIKPLVGQRSNDGKDGLNADLSRHVLAWLVTSRPCRRLVLSLMRSYKSALSATCPVVDAFFLSSFFFLLSSSVDHEKRYISVILHLISTKLDHKYHCLLPYMWYQFDLNLTFDLVTVTKNVILL